MLAVTVPPSISADFVEIDNNLVIADGSWDVAATDGHVQVFGNSKGRIDGTAGQSNEDLLLSAQSYITVTGAIGSSEKLDDLTITSATAQPVALQQSVALTGDLHVTKAGTFTIGSTTTIGGDLVIDAATTVLFAGNVTVTGNLTITQASSVTFAGTLSVGGALTIADVSGATRFTGDVSVGSASVTSTTNLQVQGGFVTTSGDVSFTTNKINLSTAMLSGSSGSTLVIQPRTVASAIAIGSPPGIATGLSITDADLAAIQSGWKRVVFGDEAAGTGAVRVGSIGSQYGGYSQLLNTTTIVGGSITVEQAVDATSLADYLEFNARTGGITIDAPINQTAEERNDWVRLRAAGAIAINKPIFAQQTVSLSTTSGGTISQAGGVAGGSAITAPSLAVDADGSVTLADSGNAVTTVAITTTNDDIVLREDSGYDIGEIKTTDSARTKGESATVTGIAAGTGTVRLVTNASTVTQTKALTAAELGLEGVGGIWNLSLATNDIDRLAADTGSLTVSDSDDATVGSVLAVVPQKALSGIRATGAVSVTTATSVAVKQAIDGGSTVDLTGTTTVGIEAAIKAVGAVTLDAGTVLTLSAAGDVTSDKASGTAVTLRGAGGISTTGDVTTLGGDVVFDNAVTLTGAIVLSTVDGKNTGLVRFKNTVDGTKSGLESLAITGNLETLASVGVTTALESLSVSGTSSLAGGTTVRTVGNQTYTGAATSAGVVTVRAGAGSAVKFLGDATLGGLVTTAEKYDVALTGSTVVITDAVTFLNAGAVTLGDEAGDSLTFNGGLTSTAPSVTNLAGTIATSDDVATIGKTFLKAATTVSTGTAGMTFSGTVDGGQTLAVNTTGTTTFGGAVGGTTALTSLTTDKGGTAAINGGSVKTSGVAGQVYNDEVTLGANTVLDADAGAITFAGTLDGSYRLDANTTGTTTFGGAVGLNEALAHLETNAGGTTVINGGSVKTRSSDSQVYNDAVTLGANTVLDAGTGGITFASTLDGAFTLVANTAGTTTFSGVVGGTTALVSLATDAGGTTAVNGGSVKTSGTQQYNDAVTLGANSSFTGSGVAYGSTLQGSSKTLSIDAGATGVSFGGNVGTSLLPLGAIDVKSVGVVSISGDIFSTGPVAISSSGDGITTTDGAVIDAGAGTILLNAAKNIALGGLTTTNATADAVKVTSIGGAITDGGDTDTDIVAASTNAVVTLRAATGIGMGNALEINAASVLATTTAGGIGLAGIGDLSIGLGGLSAPGVIALTATGSIRVPTGGQIKGGSVTANKPILWTVLNTADKGAGSLRQVIANANATGVEGVAVFTTKTATFTPASPLPAITTKFTIDGTGKSIALDGSGRVATGLVLAAGSAGSTLRGIVVRNFTGTGVVLDASAGTTVAGCVIQANGNGLSATGNLAGATVIGNTFDRNRLYGISLTAARGLSVDGNTVTGVNSAASMGLYATGDLTGTRITSNTFSGGLRGALLDGARNLVFGEASRGNSLLNNRAAPGTSFAGTGIRAQGNLAGTTVRANTFTGNNYGMAFINARSLIFGGPSVGDRNTINTSSIAAVFVEGNNTGSAQVGTILGTGNRANAKPVHRVKGAVGL